MHFRLKVQVTCPVSPVPHPYLPAAVDEGAVQGLVGAGGDQCEEKKTKKLSRAQFLLKTGIEPSCFCRQDMLFPCANTNKML